MRSHRKKALKLEQWAEGRSFLIALFGPQAAAIAMDLSEAFTQIKARKSFGYQFPSPSLPAWFELYRTHRKLDDFLKSLFSRFSPFGPEVVELADKFMREMRQRGRAKTPIVQKTISPDELAAAHLYLQKILNDFFNELAKDFSEEPIDSEERKALLKFLEDNEPVTSFFILVHVPCWLLYKTSPTRLYHKALKGDDKALEKLLSLDSLMIHDPCIGASIQKIRIQGKPRTYRKLLEAPLKDPKAKIDSKRIKYVLAGYLSAIAHLVKKRLTEREIRDLFHAATRDATKDHQAFDLDLLVDQPTFAQAVYRERQNWLAAMKSDKKS